MTAKGLQRAAVAWVELERRGENLSAYRNPLTVRLPDIASGKLNPELIIHYGANRAVLSSLAELVPEDQAKLAVDKATVEVMTPTGPKTRRVNDLRVAELKQVFGGGKIRTPAEQKRFMAPAPKAAKAPEPTPLDGDDFDVRQLLTSRQADRVRSAAAAKHMTPAEFLVDLLTRNRVITSSKASGRRQDFKASAEARAW
jgi:hypothetical protein